MEVARRLTVTKSGEDVLLILAVGMVPPIDRERRTRLTRDLVRRAARKIAGKEMRSDDGSVSFRFEGTQEPLIQRMAQHLESRVAQILTAPLTPKTVDRVLGISSRERLRWYKDGRLPTCGRGTVGRGAYKVQFPLFPMDAVARLLADPCIIEAWRNQDLEPPHGSLGSSAPTPAQFV